MPAPKADPPGCDTPGCGGPATRSTDGSEEDSQGLGRKALPNLNTCDHHSNWPFSDDAKEFAIKSKVYQARGKK